MSRHESTLRAVVEDDHGMPTLTMWPAIEHTAPENGLAYRLRHVRPDQLTGPDLRHAAEIIDAYEALVYGLSADRLAVVRAQLRLARRGMGPADAVTVRGPESDG